MLSISRHERAAKLLSQDFDASDKSESELEPERMVSDCKDGSANCSS